jgi:hypothetical protein
VEAHSGLAAIKKEPAGKKLRCYTSCRGKHFRKNGKMGKAVPDQLARIYLLEVLQLHYTFAE